MSNFIYERCGKHLYDTPKGYVTGCEHYPVDKNAIDYYINRYMIIHVSILKMLSAAAQEEWHLGAKLWKEREEERHRKGENSE